MFGQSKIQTRLSQPENTDRVKELCSANPDLSRTELARLVCDEFDFVDRQGRRQQSGSLKALRVLEKRGVLVLPAPRSNSGRFRPRRLASEVAPPEGVPDQVGEIHGLDLVLVESEELMRVWNTLMLDEHPQGAGPLVGRQLRYLIGSEHGWLGGLGFASAALHLRARDRWIGWDFETRQAQLDQVVCMSRFLVRPSVECRNLASRVLGLAMKRFGKDFEARYGYEPWVVETFVDTRQHEGVCYRASNWIRVGSTQGRGRQDRRNDRTKSVKDIFVYVLAKDFRSRLGLSADAGLGPLSLDVGLEADTWAEREFGRAPLGDKRLSQRLVESATVQAASPMESFPGAAKGERALIKGHYRLIDQPDDSAVTMENILLPHREQTTRRMKAHEAVLCIHDGTDLNYNGAAQCEGLGVIGTNQTGTKSQGLHLHSTLCVTEEGLPLGVLSARCDAPFQQPEDDERSRTEVPIEEKKTFEWILALRDCEAIAAEIPHTRILQVMDREADFYELFDEWSQGPRRTDLLVRAKYNRRTTGEEKLFDGLRNTKPKERFQLLVNRQSKRPKKSKQKARPKRPERIAEITLRYQQVELRPPPYLRDRLPITLWIIHLLEEQPPDGVKPLEWFLLTTREINSTEKARLAVEHYGLRWRIEDWHRVLKTGCRIEELRNESAGRIKRALAIYLVIAWRIMLMTLLGRECSDLPMKLLFSDLEIEVLTAYATSRRDLKPPERLGDAVGIVGRLGGHQARKRDPPPGHQVLWIGHAELRGMCKGFLLHREVYGDGPG